MIFCGFGKTSLIGGSVKLTENFINILDCYRRCIARKYGKQVANELLVAGTKLIVCDGTDKQIDAQNELSRAVSNIIDADTEFELTRDDRDG